MKAANHLNHLKKRLIASLIGASVVAVGAAPMVAWSQTSNASLRGNAPPNTQITAFNPATGATRQTTSNAQGRYALVGLQPGTYQISVQGGAKHTVTLTVASTATLDLTGGGANNAVPSQANATSVSAVNVTASTLAEVKTPEISTTVSQHMIDTLPQVSQNFLEFADIVPGMIFEVQGNGNTSLRAGAQNTNGVNVYIDGVGQKSYVMGGIAGQNASQGNPFPEGAIGQYKVITSNYKAEYDQVSSAAVTAQTKSGTNQFHGSIFERYTNDGYRARTPAENASGEKTPSQEKEFGATLGGPIIKDLAHFFVSYAGKRFNTPIPVVPGEQAANGVTYLPPDLAAQLGPANLPFTENLYFGKIDVEPTDRDRFELSAKIRRENQRGQVGGVNAASAALEIKNNDKRYALKWDHSGDAWFNELILAHQRTFFQPTPSSNGNGFAYTFRSPQFSGDPVILRVGPPDPRALQDKGQQGNEIKDDFTFNDIQFYGNHVIKMGVVYRDLNLTAQDAGDIDPQFFYHVTPPGTRVGVMGNNTGVALGPNMPGGMVVPGGVSGIPYQAVFTKPVTGVPGLTPKVQTKDRQYGAYIQDDWDVTDRLQLNLGVRWDYEDVGAYTNFATPQNVVDALYSKIPDRYINFAPDVFAPYAGDRYIDALNRDGSQRIQDFISNGHNRSPQKNEWQPRLGFSYDIDDDQQHVIHGGAGRSYSHNIYNFLQLEKTKSALPELTIGLKDPSAAACYRNFMPCYNFDPSLLNGQENLRALIGATSNAGTEVDLLNNNLKTPHTDQYSLGMSNKIGDWQTDVTVTRILYYDGFAFTLGGRWPDGSFFNTHVQPNPKVHGNPIPGFGALILGQNGIRKRNTQVLVSAQKPFTQESGWGATFAYTHSDAKQNRSIRGHYAFDYETIGDYPFLRSNFVAEHRIVMSGSYQGPWGLVFGAKLKLATDVPFVGISCFGPNSNHPTTFANGSHCHAYEAKPEGGRFIAGGKIWGERDVDFQVTKHFKLGHGISMYARFDLLNAFNFKNLTGIIADQSGGPGNERVRYNPNGGITFVPRTVKFEVGANF